MQNKQKNNWHRGNEVGVSGLGVVEPTERQLLVTLCLRRQAIDGIVEATVDRFGEDLAEGGGQDHYSERCPIAFDAVGVPSDIGNEYQVQCVLNVLKQIADDG